MLIETAKTLAEMVTEVAKRLAGRVDADLSLMNYLAHHEKETKLWMGPYLSWAGFLRGTKACTLARYEAYKEARRLGLDATRYGVDAVCTLAKMEAEVRRRVLKALVRDTGKYTGYPSVQLIGKLAKDAREEIEGPSRERYKKAQKARAAKQATAEAREARKAQAEANRKALKTRAVKKTRAVPKFVLGLDPDRPKEKRRG